MRRLGFVAVVISFLAAWNALGAELYSITNSGPGSDSAGLQHYPNSSERHAEVNVNGSGPRFRDTGEHNPKLRYGATRSGEDA